MLPRTLSVMRQFPFSPEHPGIGHMAVHAISFSEPPVFEQTFDDRVDPAQTITLARTLYTATTLLSSKQFGICGCRPGNMTRGSSSLAR